MHKLLRFDYRQPHDRQAPPLPHPPPAKTSPSHLPCFMSTTPMSYLFVSTSVVILCRQGVEGMAEQLRGVLGNPRTTAAEAAAPMRLLLQLQADGAATVQPLNPVKLYLDTQVPPNYLRKELKLNVNKARLSRPTVQPLNPRQAVPGLPGAAHSALLASTLNFK